jgi:hypothetical protein
MTGGEPGMTRATQLGDIAIALGGWHKYADLSLQHPRRVEARNKRIGPNHSSDLFCQACG